MALDNLHWLICHETKRKEIKLLRSISPIYSLVHFNDCQEHLTMKNAQVFILAMRLQSFILRSFLILLRNSFITFSFISFALMLSASSVSNYLSFSLSPIIPMFS